MGRYAEDDSESEESCDKLPKSVATNDYGQDTLKTYCTEGTPYETPFNFSTATSMSDLREGAGKVIDNDQHAKANASNSMDEKDHCSIEDLSEKVVKSQLSSGMISPDKPVSYAMEGTPEVFSIAGSCGSLNLLVPPEEKCKDELGQERDGQHKSDDVPIEGKD